MTHGLSIVRRGSCGKNEDSCIIAIVTQLSIDRLDRLQYLCESWGGDSRGHVIAAILDEDRSDEENLVPRLSSIKRVQVLEATVNKLPCCSLETILVGRKFKDNASYPINGLRNIALEKCTTELVFLLDVDCIPSTDALYNIIGTAERLSSIRKMCTEEAIAIVVPCFEPVPSCQSTISPVFTTVDVYKRLYAPGTQADLQPFMGDRFNRGHRATDFPQLVNIWKHRLASLDRSTYAPRFYPIAFEEGFEPYVIVNRMYAPRYDDALIGYGRNKALHLYHLYRLGVTFAVCADACLVHLPHAATTDRDRLLGSSAEASSIIQNPGGHTVKQGLQPGLLQEIKDIYTCSRTSITNHCSSWAIEPAVKNCFQQPQEAALQFSGDLNDFDSGHPFADEPFNGATNDCCVGWKFGAFTSSSRPNEATMKAAPVVYPVGSACCWWEDDSVREYAAALIGRHNESISAATDEQQSDDSSAALHSTLANLCSMHMRYEAPVLHIQRQYTIPKQEEEALTSPPPAGTAPTVWLVTHLSVDRLDKLRALCRCWRGPLAAAVWLQPTLSAAEHSRSVKDIATLVEEVQHNDSGVYCCDLKLVKVENQFVEGVFRGKLNPRVSADRNALGEFSVQPSKKSPLSSTIYPVNALRGAAVDIVIEHARGGSGTSVNAAANLSDESLQHDLSATLVFIVDVDMRPTDLLCRSLSYSRACTDGSMVPDALMVQLAKACVTDGKFVVFPALEVVDNTPVDGAAVDSRCGAAFCIDQLLHATDIMAVRRVMSDLRDSERIRAFHASTYAAGHAATDTNSWFQSALTSAVLAGDAPVVLREVQHQEGWEPYGILSLRTFIQSGGFNRCFVGWHKDKIDFIKRLSAHNVAFAVCTDTRAFVLDWQPHDPCGDRVRTRVDPLYLAAMQGLYNRSCRQHLALTERSADEVYSDSRCVGDGSACVSGSVAANGVKVKQKEFDSFHTLRASDVLLMDFWKSDSDIKVCASAEGKENITLSSETGVFKVSMAAGSLSSPMGGVSFTMQRLLPAEKILPILAVRFQVCFPKDFSWKGGGCLPGVSMGARRAGARRSTYMDADFECRGRWNDRGLLSYHIRSGDGEWEVVLDRKVQLHRDSWHSIVVVVEESGLVTVRADAAELFVARCGVGALNIIGVRMCVFCNDVALNASHVLLKSVAIAVERDSVADLHPSDMADVRRLIEKDVTVIFAPKEVHSLCLAALTKFLSMYPIVAHLIVVIAPPISTRLIGEIGSCVSAHCAAVGGPQVFRYTLHHATPFQNPYQVRNEIVATYSICTKYTLHINNDVLSGVLAASCTDIPPAEDLARGWLEELVRYAEAKPEYWAAMPLLLERNAERWGLHVWWDQTGIVSPADPGSTAVPTQANEALLGESVENLPVLLRQRLASKPLLFLEDHVLLVQTDKFPPSAPLFDPLACYRREFFDLAWQIRARGGDIGMALNSVITYVKVQPLQLDDVPYFVHRRQDELCYMSQQYLNHKWRINYRTDRWHAKQLHEALRDTRFCGVGVEEMDQLSALRLVLCMFVAAGANRFQVTERCEDLHPDEASSKMESVYDALACVHERLQHGAPQADIVITFAQDEVKQFSFDTPSSSVDLSTVVGIDHLASLDVTLNHFNNSVATDSYAKYCFYKICWAEKAPSGQGATHKSSSALWETVCFAQPCLRHLFSILLQYQCGDEKATQGQNVCYEGWVWMTEDISREAAVTALLQKVCSVAASLSGVPFAMGRATFFEIVRCKCTEASEFAVAELLLWEYAPFSFDEIRGAINNLNP